MVRQLEHGVIYVAMGRDHWLEAKRSIQSIRQHSDVPVTVFTDQSEEYPVNIVHVAQPYFGFRDKVECIPLTPYGRTIYLDTDTLILRADALDIYPMLDRFQIALSHAAVRCFQPVEGLPTGFATFNSGVILFSSSEPVRHLFWQWQRAYNEALKRRTKPPKNPKGQGDQVYLTRALYHSDLRIATLPAEWNYRGIYPHVRDFDDIRVLHNREAISSASLDSCKIDLKALKSWFSAHKAGLSETDHPIL